MASTMDAGNAQQKFTSLRKRLDQLGYRHPLGIESLPLVERLFADLVHTTESLKKAKLEGSKAPVDNGRVDGRVEAYKSDNAKLVKENNQLHQQLIKKTDEAHALATDLKASIRKLENENADLRFLNNQYVHKIRALEKESKQKTEKMLQLQEKNFHAVVHTPGGRQKQIPFRRQRMDVDCLLSPSDPEDQPEEPTVEDPYLADLLRVADNTIAQLREEARQAKAQKEGLDGKINGFKKQVEARDHEIERLNGLLEGGRPYDLVALEARNRSNERLISHLNIQIDYLQTKNAEMQQQLDDALLTTRKTANQTLELDSRNVELSKELESVDRMAQQLQTDRDSALRTADAEIIEARYELEKARNEVQKLEIELAEVNAMQDRTMADKNSVESDLTSEQAEVARLQDLLDKLTTDKRKLANRVNKLLANERELVLEIDRLKHRNGHAKKRGKSPNRLEIFIKGLEEERDYWKSEVDVLQKLMRSSRRQSTLQQTRSRSRTPSRSNSRPSSRPASRPSSRPSSRAASPVPSAKLSSLESKLRSLERERDQLRHEVESRRMRSRSPSPTRSSLKNSDSEELCLVRQERDELQKLLDKFERHMAEIQANVKVLTKERDNLSALYEDTKDELTRLRREVVRSPKSPKTSLAAAAVLRRVENERDDALADLRRMTTERDTLRQRLKIATETALADRARLDQRVDDLEAALKGCERERASAEERAASMQRLADQLEVQMKEQDVLIAQARDDTNHEKSNNAHLRLLVEQAEQAAALSKQQVLAREAEVARLQGEIGELDARLGDVQRSHTVQHDEIGRLRATIAALDADKDGLQTAVDDKAESLQATAAQLRDAERQIDDLKRGLNEQEMALERSRSQTADKERELSSLRRQLDSTGEELSEVGRAREVALRENRRQQDDLAAMTRENQSLNAELDEALQEKEDLKNQVQDYVVEVKRAEDLIASKEQERSDLLEQYRSLSLDAERYETTSHQLESESSNLRLELMTKDSEVRRLREKVDSLERELDEHVAAEHDYEQRVSSLSGSLAATEDAVRRAERLRDDSQHDVAAVRDLAARLESQKEKLQRQLTAKILDEEKLQGLVDELRSEMEMLRGQVGTERTSVKSLESLLQSNREKELSAQMSLQEHQAELQLLRDRQALNDSKIESQNRELANVRARLIEIDSENDRMRRQLTNERFERERAVQELRRHGLSVPGEGRATASSRQSPTLRSRSPSPTTRHLRYT